MSIDSESRYWRWTVIYILAFSLVWWGVFAFSRHYLDGADMVENYAWGIEWQWGTNKHPPLFGWITAAWFKLLPVSDGAYYLLNEVNLAAAMLLLALAMKRVESSEKVLAAIVLASMGTHFGPDSGFKYNANTALLPFIAGYLWAMLHGLENRKTIWFVAAGLFGAAALLTKYYALVMFLAIGIGILVSLRPPLMELLKGSAIAGLTALLVVLPHVVWSMRHGWPSLHYMHAAHEIGEAAGGLEAHALTLIGATLFSAVALLAWGGSFVRLPATRFPANPRPRLGLSIFLTGVILTLLAAWAQDINPVSSWLIPILMFLGWALMDLTPMKFDAASQAGRITRMGVLYLVAAVIFAAVWEIRYRAYPAPPAYALPKVIAQDVTRLYRSAYGQPIEFAVGTFPLPYDLSFYSPDHPHGLYGVDLAQSPWIDPHALKTGNRVAVCGSLRFTQAPDPDCATTAQALFGRPDQVATLKYPVYDPKTRHQGQQTYQVLFWKPKNSL